MAKKIDRRNFLKGISLACAGAFWADRLLIAAGPGPAHVNGKETRMPNIVLIMTDDQGWGETGYYNHPALKTPNLDAMAANGLRFDRFYAGAPVCSPTRASVLTGRANDRCGVPNHGHALRLQEKTLPQALKRRGYATGHFGKWHLDGLTGPGAPILKDDPRGPGAFGFDEWLSATNYFDMDPVLSRKGKFESFKGDTSSVIVGEALKFIRAAAQENKPFFAVIWDGSPHRPWIASKEDQDLFPGLDEESRKHYGELAAFDRGVGMLRKGLRDLKIADDTLVWYCSDNGGLGGVNPGTVGGLRGLKGSVWEGGLRVPGIVEWPSAIKHRVTSYPASTMDIFPTIAEMLELPESDLLEPVDGASLIPLFGADIARREKPIPFRYQKQGALVDNEMKLVTQNIGEGRWELYDLKADAGETRNIAEKQTGTFSKIKSTFEKWNTSVDNSVAGKDYPEGKVRADEPKPRSWTSDERYQALFAEWEKKPEYSRLMRQVNSRKK